MGKIQSLAGGDRKPVAKRGRIFHIKGVFSVANALARILVDSENVRHAEEGVVSLEGGGLVYADESAALVSPFRKLRDDLVVPQASARPDAVCAARVDNDVKRRKRAVFHVVKVDERYVKRHTRERFDHVDEIDGRMLVIMARAGPRAQRPPRGENRDARL